MSGFTGFVGNTDHDWFRYLRSKGTLDEVNFWRPSGGAFKAIEPGAPFFFRLKKPHACIGGFGYFAHFSRVPASLAWESFGELCGTQSFSELQKRLAKYRRERLDPRSDPMIGCIMVSSPTFFADEEWVRQPSSWRDNTVVGKRLDLASGEGQRIWKECRERATRSFEIHEESDARYGEGILVRPRLGQGTFRIAVSDAYERACAVTGEHSLPALEAAHIRPYGEGGEHRVSNGLLLRSDVHRLFDRGYVTVTPDYEFRVSSRLRDDFSNGRSYYPLQGRRIVVPGEAIQQPDRELLAWHRERIFLG